MRDTVHSETQCKEMLAGLGDAWLKRQVSWVRYTALARATSRDGDTVDAPGRSRAAQQLKPKAVYRIDGMALLEGSLLSNFGLCESATSEPKCV